MDVSRHHVGFPTSSCKIDQIYADAKEQAKQDAASVMHLSTDAAMARTCAELEKFLQDMMTKDTMIPEEKEEEDADESETVGD